MKQGENYLLVCVGVLSWFSQNSKTNYKLEEDQMIWNIGSKMIKKTTNKEILSRDQCRNRMHKSFMNINLLVTGDNIVVKEMTILLISIRFGNYNYEAISSNKREWFRKMMSNMRNVESKFTYLDMNRMHMDSYHFNYHMWWINWKK